MQQDLLRSESRRSRVETNGGVSDAGTDRMPALLARFWSDRECLRRLFPVPFSPSRSERLRRFLTEWNAELAKVSGGAERTRGDQADILLFQAHLAAEKRHLDREEARFAAAAPVLSFAPDLIALEEERRQLRPIEPESAAQRLDRAQAQIGALQSALEGGARPVGATIAAQAARLALEICGMLEAWFAFYHRYDPLFDWWVETPYRAVTSALREYARVLREQVAGATGDTVVGEPLGRAALLGELRHAQVPYTPEELIAAARGEVEWCRAEMRRAARKMGRGDDWRAALEQVKATHVAPGEQPALVRDLAQEAIAYVAEHDLVTVPPLAQECWRMEMMSPERQKINPFFLGGETIIVSFPTSEMAHAQKRMSLRGNNRAFARATVYHELIPGHHLQMFSQERYRPYRRLFTTPFWTEGWTLHWEMLFWERGFARTPEERIGMLFWRMHRGARVIFSLEFHLGQRTAAECIEMLVEEAGHERDNAVAEVRRSFEGDYDPLYQAAYLIGGWQMHALYRELVHGKEWSDREFHDAVLQENCMPIPTLRALLTGRPVDDDLPGKWRFLDGKGDVSRDSRSAVSLCP